MKKNNYKDQGLYESSREHDACGIGAVVNINGTADHSIINYGKQILLNLHHRGAAGADEVTGDGAGILFQIPHEFFVNECDRLKISLPQRGQYGVGIVFGSKDKKIQKECEAVLEAAVGHYGMKVLGWRDVPVSNGCLGKIALESEPTIRQIFVDACEVEGEVFERKLFLARKRAENQVREKLGEKGEEFYVSTLSSRLICYKGMFMAWQLFAYYPDLADENVKSALAVVHQRYSTNTFPSWRLAQPFRSIAHNGEINTLSGNKNHTLARQSKMASELFGDDIKDIFPVLVPGGSDSACFDNMVELLIRSGRSIPHSMMMMIPEAFGQKYHISTYKRAFYEYHSAIMEPWDGPAAMVFTDGRLIGGTLDRNGLRPSRYLVTNDGLVILASEAGVVEFPPEKIQRKGRLRPGHMFLVDTFEGRIITDNEIKSKIAHQKPYKRWLEENRIELRGLFDSPEPVKIDQQTIAPRLRVFGYTREDMNVILTPMAVNGQEPVGSMGNDAALAVLSDKPRLMFDYFKQLFAQVTNPPIDPLREGLVMSLMGFAGKKQNLLTETPEHCKQLKLQHPILTNEDIDRLRNVSRSNFKVATVKSIFEVDKNNSGASLQNALDNLVSEAIAAVRGGASILIISDRGISEQMAAIPSLLATSAVYHGLLENGLGSEAGIVVESGEPREVMHFCLLCGFGANAVNPYLALEALEDMRQDGEFGNMEPVQLIDNYVAAIKKGIMKTISKMGISTLRSYRAAQLFESVGLNIDFVKKYFTGVSSRISGVGIDEIAKEAILRHGCGYESRPAGMLDLDFGGQYQYKQGEERHLWNPVTLAKLQHAVFNEDEKSYKEFSEAVDNQSKQLCTLRGLFNFKFGDSVPIEEVEPASEIVKRFCTGAMSHGSISKEAHECMAIAMNRIGGMSNTGEGGEDPQRYILESNGDDKNCAIKQVASARFGVTMEYLAHAKVIQIKMAQGAKPGEGGQLPGQKVTEEIAKLRYSTPGVTLISPPPHHDIYSIEDLAQLIYDLKCSNPGVKVSVKLVSEVGVGTVAAGVAKGNADEVLISGHDGGTGASPLSSIKHTGGPWELGLAETQQVLVLNKLRDRIKVQVDGQLRTGRDVAIGALLGADHFGFGTAALVCMGCTMLRKCHEGACTYGIATQDAELRKRFTGKPEYIIRFMHYVAEDVRQIMAQLGFRKFEEMTGRVDKLDINKAIEHWKTKGLDLSPIFYMPDTSDGRAIRAIVSQPDKLKDHLDWKIIEKVQSAIENKQKMTAVFPIRNVNRTVGTILSNHIVKKWGPQGLPDGTLDIVLQGSAGQSLGAFLCSGVTLRLIGDANDYIGKGLSGGRIVIKTPQESRFMPHENIVAGNTILYGATRGECFINGMAGERFAVRNSGATAVVEGVGDHCCEYMTGGTVVVLGETGCNFGAGMSGGIAYVLDQKQLFDTLCNLDMVELETVWNKEDIKLLRSLIEKHYKLTESKIAKLILDSWTDSIGKFVKVMPLDYRKALQKMRDSEQRDTESTPATEEVYPWVK